MDVGYKKRLGFYLCSVRVLHN